MKEYSKIKALRICKQRKQKLFERVFVNKTCKRKCKQDIQEDILMEKNYIQNNGKAKGKIYIGLDHGYGNIKTAHRVFTTGVEAYDEEPIVSTNFVKYREKYYVIGESHLVYQGNKTDSDDFYILTLAGLAEELKFRGLHEAEVVLAVGLPLERLEGLQSGN